MVAAYKYLRGNRNRPLLPHRQLAPMRELLQSMAEMAHVASDQLGGDDRWRDAAEALDAAADALKRVLVTTLAILALVS